MIGLIQSFSSRFDRRKSNNPFSEGLLDEFGGAAAAYSLRTLGGGYSGSIVRVRRDGDADGATNERDFDSTTSIEDWVNGKLETTLPADVATLSAAYSLRKVKAGYTGDAVRVRRASDNVEVNVAFDTNGAVSANSAITNIVDTVLAERTDFSSSLSPFTATTGNTSSFDESIGGRTQVYKATYDGSGTLGLNFNTNLSSGTVIKLSLDAYWLSSNTGSPPVVKIRQGAGTIGSSDQTWSDYGGEDEWVKFDYQFTLNTSVSTLTLRFDDDSAGTPKVTGDAIYVSNIKYSVVNDAGDTTATTLGGFLTESINVYTQTSDLSVLAGSGTQYSFPSNAAANTIGQTYEISFEAKRNSGGSGTHGDVRLRTPSTWDYTVVSISNNLTAETNRFRLNTSSESYQTYTVTVTTNSGSSESPLRIQTFDTDDDYTVRNAVFKAVNHNAHVQTWYDQSGNNYHLTQDTAGSQPKIAETGALLTLAGKPTIRPDGSDDFLINENAIWDTISNTNLSCMAVSEKTSLTNRILWAIGSDSNEDGDWLIGGGGVVGDVRFRGGRINSETSPIGTSGATLFTALDVTGGDGFINGTAIGSPQSVSPNQTADRLVLFTRRGTSSLGTCTNQDISEIIFYNSDQSSNRFKIESNINNYYGIYTASHNGFVHTWYDQSGNGNNATQDTQENDQPKIVNAGSLLADGIDFDGASDFFTASGVTTTQPYSVFMKIKASETGAVQQIIDSVSATPAFFQFSTAGVLSINNPTSTVTSLDLTSTPTDVLISGFIDDPKTAFADGASILSPASGTGTNSLSGLTIGKHRNLSSNYYSGNFSELIIYDSDQSANRSGIESNIADHYGITLP